MVLYNRQQSAMEGMLYHMHALQPETRMFLNNNGIAYGRDLVKLTPAQLQAMPGFKMQYFEEIELALGNAGLCFGFQPHVSLDATLDEVNMDERAAGVFRTAGVHTVGQLIRMDRAKAEALPRISKSTVKGIEHGLSFYGLKFGMREATQMTTPEADDKNAQIAKALSKVAEAKQLLNEAETLLRFLAA